MRWKIFFQAVLLLILAGIIGYCIAPKYYFIENDTLIIRGNRLTGVMEVYQTMDDKWKLLGPR